MLPWNLAEIKKKVYVFNILFYFCSVTICFMSLWLSVVNSVVVYEAQLTSHFQTETLLLVSVVNSHDHLEHEQFTIAQILLKYLEFSFTYNKGLKIYSIQEAFTQHNFRLKTEYFYAFWPFIYTTTVFWGAENFCKQASTSFFIFFLNDIIYM